jgi:hypothetical protein
MRFWTGGWRRLLAEGNHSVNGFLIIGAMKNTR